MLAVVLRRRLRLLTLAALVVTAIVGVDLSGIGSPAPASDQPPHHTAHGFRNVDPRYSYSLLRRVANMVPHLVANHRGRPLELAEPDLVALHGRGPAITWVGHSTFLVELDGVNLLTDPNWADHVGPFPIAAQRRLVAPGILFDELPRIDAVVISHDHYDHLDAGTVKRLAREHHPTFFVPLGIKAWLAGLGIEDVVELDWWDSVTFGPLTLVCTPAQHSSGRSLTLSDQNQRLWASWVIESSTKRFFFAGDTGYYGGLAEIGRRLGPFDLAALPIGGYSDFRRHHPNHLNPEEAVQAMDDLRAERMVPMHWGTFALNREPFREPPDRLVREATRRGVGDRVSLLHPGQTIPW